MKPTLLTWLLGGALAASLALHALCWSRSCNSPLRCVLPDGPDAGPNNGAVSCLDGLDLTPEQQQQIASCCGERCAGAAATERVLEVATARLQEALAAEAPDAAAVRALAEEVGALRMRIVTECAESILLLRGILTPEQRARLQQCCSPVSKRGE